MGNSEEEIEIDLVELLNLLMHRIWLVLFTGIVGGAIGLVISMFLMTPKYESTTKVYILNKENNSGTISYSDTQLATQLTKDYEELIKSRNVLERVISDLRLDESYEGLIKKIRVENKTDTRIISIIVKDTSPEEAQRIANEIRNVSAEHITAVMDIRAVNVVDDANLPDVDKPVEPSVFKYAVTGFCIGVFLSAALILIGYIMDDTIKVSDDVEKHLDLPTLGLIPVMGDDDDKKKKRVKTKKKKIRSADYKKYEKHKKDSEGLQIVELEEDESSSDY